MVNTLTYTMRPATGSTRIVALENLSRADLHVDSTFEGGRRGNAGDDPLPRLLSVSNQGGFRYRGRIDSLDLVVLTSTFNDADWPDALDEETGILTYFGDNKHPGRALHETPRNGNRILRRLFDLTHSGDSARMNVPPILVFASTGIRRDLIFLGLAVPGSSSITPLEDLVAIWKTSGGHRFQNYRAQLTVLDVPVVSRAWLLDVIGGNPHSSEAPEPWTRWAETGTYLPLVSSPSLEYRTKREQLPQTTKANAIVSAIYSYFEGNPYGFEKCAGKIVELMLRDVASLDLTRPSRDGGRDAIGKLRIGKGPPSILCDFAVEAKCYSRARPVGVRGLSRLISRLRHRQFGVLVTTSYLDLQAYKELKEDQHPVIVIAGGDIVELLRMNGLAEVAAVKSWLTREFPS